MKSKITLFIALLSLLIVQCQKQDKKETMELKEYKYKSDKRPVYVLGLNIPGPHEVYVNDILVAFENGPSMHNYGADINPYILKSGTYNFKVRIYPTVGEEKGIKPETAKLIRVTLDTAERNLTGQGGTRTLPDTYKVLEVFKIPQIEKPVPYLDVSGSLKIDVPYDLEGWSNGQDLRKMDQKILLEKVIDYYQNLWTLLNEGNIDEWEKLTKKRKVETDISLYNVNSDQEIYKNELDKMKSLTKEMMAPMEDYTMKIYADGKIVSLERKNHTTTIFNKDIDIKNESPLMRKAKVRGVMNYPIKLYLPQNSDEFVIIRK